MPTTCIGSPRADRSRRRSRDANHLADGSSSPNIRRARTSSTIATLGADGGLFLRARELAAAHHPDAESGEIVRADDSG